MTQPGEWKTEFQKVIDHLKRELGGLRTGRASSALVEDIQVEAYGTKIPFLSRIRKPSRLSHGIKLS